MGNEGRDIPKFSGSYAEKPRRGGSMQESFVAIANTE
jgi:hypothetical protein